MEQRQSFQQIMLKQVDIHNARIFSWRKKIKKNLDTNFIPFTKINSKCTIDLNIKCKKYKTANIQEIPDDIGHGKEYLVTPPKV